MRHALVHAARRRIHAKVPPNSGAFKSRCFSSDTQPWSTPLARNIAEAINVTGPISLAAYMRQCLTSTEGGYYTSSSHGKDQFGRRGDFITSPEISQIFGELVGLWVVAEWIAQGRASSGVELVEVGPGRGTLMDDMLRSIRHFKPLASSIETVYLVEASPSLRESQRKLLCGDRPMEETPHGFRSRSKYSGIPIIWCEDIRFVPSQPGRSPFIVAHEFFDALPIHAFQSVAPSNTHGTVQGPGPVPRPSREAQWRELVVSPAPVASSTTARIAAPGTGSAQTDPAEFVLSVAKASTPNSLVLPDRSPRYQALRHTAGATIEVCPEGQSYAEEFARRIGGAPGDAERGSSPSGAALILDYGPASTIPVSSLRGIRSHHHVSPFSSPGLVDLSADVDFAALAEAALRASPAVEVHGPVEQGGFLQAMGITERAEQLSSHLGAHEVDARTRIESGWMRLVDRGIDGMGKLYKAMAIIPVTGGVRRPVGFGGDIAE